MKKAQVTAIKPVTIHGREIGPGHPCFIIAEAGVNHNGDIKLARSLIAEARKAGADAVKFQSFITEEVVTPHAPKADYQVSTTGTSGAQMEMIKALELSGEQHAELKAYCEEVGILYLSTPYDHTSADILDEMDVAAYKIASTDTTNSPFLRHVARKGRPIILSTGMCTLEEVVAAVSAIRDEGLKDLIILHCTSEYPSPAAEANLRAMATMETAFDCPVGFSDHTQGIETAVWAVAAGACMIEKHFTLDKNMKGPDHAASMTPSELAHLVESVRNVERALGDGIKKPMPSEVPNIPRMRKSVVARTNIPAGHVIRESDLACRRPGNGIQPGTLEKLLGKTTKRAIAENELIAMSDVDWTA